MSQANRSEAFLNSVQLNRGDVVFKAHPRARRYLAKVDKTGNIVLTVPNGGTRRGALSFANQHRDWLLEQRKKALVALEEVRSPLRPGESILFRGERTELRIEKDWGRPVLRLATERIFIADEGMDLARPLKAHLRAIAKAELPGAVADWAALLRIRVSKVTVRDQKTRWGSCSTSGTISLNWRLVLADPATRDYVIIHELMHRKRFDHSARFWALVEQACPEYRIHEAWLNAHYAELNW